MMRNRNGGKNLRLTVWSAGAVLLCLALVTATAPAKADDGSGSKDNGKSQQKLTFIVGPVTKTPDPSGKGQDNSSKGNKSDGGNSGSQHH